MRGRRKVAKMLRIAKERGEENHGGTEARRKKRQDEQDKEKCKMQNAKWTLDIGHWTLDIEKGCFVLWERSGVNKLVNEASISRSTRRQ